MAKKSDPSTEPKVAEVDGQKEVPDHKDHSAPDAVVPESPETKSPKGGSGNKFKQLLGAYLAKKKLTIPLTVLVLIGLLAAVPFTRYAIAGTVVKNDVTVTVLDETSKKPVSKASVSLGDAVGQTDEKGVVKLRTSVGTKQAVVTKKYYADGKRDVLVGIVNKKSYEITVKATGRQVSIRVINKINTVGIDGAVVSAAGTEVKTSNDGKAIIVLPPDNPKATAKITAGGFNDAEVTIPVTDNMKGVVTFELVPAGKVYFLSKLSGKIDVVKTNLDGTERQTVLAGTGKEDNYDTVMLASTDWKYLALKSKRDGGANPKLFLIDTSNDKVTTMDEGNAGFQPVGWSGEYFVYHVARNGYNNWQSGAVSLKSYNARTAKITVLDTTRATGTGNWDANYESLFSGNVFIVDGTVVFSKLWYAYPGYISVAGQENTLTSVRPDGTKKTTVGKYASNEAYFGSIYPYNPKELYVQVTFSNNQPQKYFEYEGGKLVAINDLDEQKFNNQQYPTYLISPDGKNTFWSEDRDGKNTLFVGNDEGEDGKQIASLSEYKTYGWFTDKYLLTSKNGSELYIMQVAGGTQHKITDYHKPNYSFRGYGGGYGGL
jgi:hypothetical protein